jgi:hypothetical protein
VLLVLPVAAAGEMHVLLEAMIADMAAAGQAVAQQGQPPAEAYRTLADTAGAAGSAASGAAGSPALHYEVVMSAAWQQQFRGLCEDLGFALGMAGEQEGMAGGGCWLGVGVCSALPWLGAA